MVKKQSLYTLKITDKKIVFIVISKNNIFWSIDNTECNKKKSNQ